MCGRRGHTRKEKESATIGGTDFKDAPRTSFLQDAQKAEDFAANLQWANVAALAIEHEIKQFVQGTERGLSPDDRAHAMKCAQLIQRALNRA